MVPLAARAEVQVATSEPVELRFTRVRWRFSGPAAVSVDDQNIDTVKAADGSVSVQLDHKGTSRLRWR